MVQALALVEVLALVSVLVLALVAVVAVVVVLVLAVALGSVRGKAQELVWDWDSEPLEPGEHPRKSQGK
jgi:NADH:ubiquinone oxidoreductase subunit 3 (subunit A)